MIEGYTQRDDCRLYHAAYGRGPAVLLLHGGLGSSLSLNHRKTCTLVDWLWHQGYQAVTFDMRGCGRSCRVEQFETDYFLTAADDAAAVLDDLEIDEAAVIGVGDGAIAALNFATRHPARVSAVVADSVPLRITPTLASASTSAARQAAQWWQQLLVEMHGADRAEHVQTLYADLMNRLATTEADLYDGKIDAVRCPVLLLASEPDRYGLIAHNRELARRIADARLAIVSEHLPVGRPVAWTAPSRFRAAAGPFLQQYAPVAVEQV